MLQSQTTFAGGGWWHDSNVLKATGDGVDTEEQRAWQGWWNESVVDLVRLSMQQTDAFTVLLTGRSERGFADVIERMVKSKRLQFHLIVLRPETGPATQRFHDTMNFKQIFLRDLIDTYSAADEIRLYEDRVKQYVLHSLLRSLNAYRKQRNKVPRILSKHPHLSSQLPKPTTQTHKRRSDRSRRTSPIPRTAHRDRPNPEDAQLSQYRLRGWNSPSKRRTV